MRPSPYPDDVIGHPVPAAFILARSSTAAVAIQHITAFPEGFDFQVAAYCRGDARVWDPMHGLTGRRDSPETRDAPGPDHLRLRLEFGDGSWIDNFGPPMNPAATPGKRRILQHLSGEARGSSARMHYWTSPLPADGGVVFIAEWPAHGIAPTRHEIDGRLVVDAASRATPVWPASI